MGGRWLQPKFGGSAAVAELPCICAAQPGPHLPTQGFKSAVHQHQSLRMIPQDTKPTQLRCRDRAQPLSGPGTVSPAWLCPAKGAVSSHCSRSRACSSQPCSAGSQHCIQLASLLMSFSSAPGHRDGAVQAQVATALSPLPAQPALLPKGAQPVFFRDPNSAEQEQLKAPFVLIYGSNPESF